MVSRDIVSLASDSLLEDSERGCFSADSAPAVVGASVPGVTPGIVAVVPAGRVYVTVLVMTWRTEYGLVWGFPRAGAERERGVLPSGLREV